MVVIRLARLGAAHNPQYRIQVADQRRYRNSRFIETVGFYNPRASGKAVGLQMDMTKVNEWIKKGAQPTDRVKTLIRKASATVA